MNLFQNSIAALTHFASVFWMTSREAAPFLVFGLILAGILHIFVSTKIISWALGYKGFKGALRAALLGVPLPLCSCSVLPTSLTLRRKGASLSSTFSFMISTPETSIDSFAITLALLPSIFLGVRPLAAILLAIGVGMLIEKLNSADSETLEQNLKRFSNLKILPQSEIDQQVGEICKVCGILGPQMHHHGIFAKIKASLVYSFKTFFDDIGVWIFFGLIMSALIEIIVPADSLKTVFWSNNQNLQIIFAILVGIPMYSCATAATPIVAALMLKGLCPGAALALLLSGPATNIGTYFILKKEFGIKTLSFYYFFIGLFCFLFGIILNGIWPLLPANMLIIPKIGSDHIFKHMIPGWLEVCSSWLIILLVLKQLVSKILIRNSHHHHAEHEHDECC